MNGYYVRLLHHLNLVVFNNIYISTAFRENNKKWEKIGNQMLTKLDRRTKNFYRFIGLSGTFYFTMPFFVYFLMPNDGTKEWPFPVQV